MANRELSDAEIDEGINVLILQVDDKMDEVKETVRKITDMIAARKLLQSEKQERQSEKAEEVPE